ncbi:MAG: Glycosyl transferase group 1 [Candidatus Uhrbacteria bacterium GW2011_GWF2_39_13]|uniref:Glycosyl transferase group 1 n=1 Tax=Candidatus Uhrbacteria bacterium GW2011_GWF2_39_13 TaxID=1618995 RepID=A0A0G0QPQ5_9BACT|nr:MAG: Glycosyl transferase group 1 [Candidatus Uhrbacteria bacterium GW2011_GWF2_39_13]
MEEISKLNIGIIHSIIGKNDGVSIVIDQTVNALVKYMKIPLGNIFFLSAYAPSRFNVTLDDILWHKNEINKFVVRFFSDENYPEDFEAQIMRGALKAKKTINKFIKKNNIHVILAHNTSHPYNFSTALGLNMALDEKREKGKFCPKHILWWHDSFYERKIFKKPNQVIRKYLKYLPGTNLDGIVFINSRQRLHAADYFKTYGNKGFNIEKFIHKKTVVIPNTCDIVWDWMRKINYSKEILSPPLDHYNRSFFKDIGVEKALEEKNLSMKNTVFLLQHTRVVPRKRIDKAIDFAFELERKARASQKHVVLIVSGASGDEQSAYKDFLINHHKEKCQLCPDANVFLFFAEDRILSSKDIIIDKKYYDYAEIPSLIAHYGGIGTYFSEVEGYGNNLLEMVSKGLPVVINKYDIYKRDIAQLGFKFPSTENCKLKKGLVEKAFRLITDIRHRNKIVIHNLEVLNKNLNHRIIAKGMKKIWGLTETTH